MASDSKSNGAWQIGNRNEWSHVPQHRNFTRNENIDVEHTFCWITQNNH